MTDDTVIKVDGLWKRYGLPLPGFVRQGRHWLRSLRNDRSPAPLLPSSPAPQDGPWSLRDVSFEVKRGETLGIIGRNGAGKSTLLKVLAGVTPPTRGKVEVRGRVFPMIELNAGLHSELTGRENVRLLGAVMGFSRQEIEAKMPEIEEFCELEEWFDRPVRMYSSGMLARLGFGVAMNVDADVLLVDEVLAVGDLAFQRRCYGRMEALHRDGVTTLFVSHSIRQVERLCERALLLDKGEKVLEGKAVEIANAYYERSTGSLLARYSELEPALPLCQTSGDITLTEVGILNSEGKATKKVRVGETVTISIELAAVNLVEQPAIAIGLVSADMVLIAAFSNEDISDRPNLVGPTRIDCTIPILPFLPGVYYVRIKIIHPDGAVLLGGEQLAAFQVVSEDDRATNLNRAGFIKLEPTWKIHALPSYQVNRQQ
jgi:ABC-type polysaccharide/polyol phosphate transport system ATPase subunit